jgi:hypothetical protein
VKRLLTLGVLLFALCAFPASAILDTNENGLSDLWEKANNGGNLLPTGFDPQDDADADGWTNEQEAAAGTSPFDANAPDGIVSPQTNHIPEVLGVSPEVIQVTWPQIPGKVYTLLFSPDLIDWLPVGEAFIGGEIEEVYIFPLTQIEGQPPPPDKLFWRVSIEDVDSDADGLTDAEEHELGTDPDNSETLAGYPDMWLAENYLPDLLNDELSSLDLNGDPDLDGLTNAQEKKLGTNPAVSDNPGIVQDSISNGEFSHPLIGSGKRSEVTDPDWDYWEGLPADEYGKTSWTAVVGTNIEYQIGTPKEGCGQYVEFKAHPGYNYGIKQQVGTRIGVTYLLVFDCRTRPGTDAANNNFSVIIDSEDPKPITFTAHTGWISKAISFKATDVITHISLVPDNNQNDTMGCFVDNVKLMPVEIQRDEEGGAEPNWQPIAGALSKALPGQKINLKIDLSKIAQNVSVSNFLWTATGCPFKDYIADSTHGDKTDLAESDLNAQTTSFYFSQPGNQTVTLNLTVNGGQTSIFTKINLVDPGSYLGAGIGGVSLHNSIVELTGIRAGIIFQSKVNSLMREFSEEGTWAYVQLIENNQEATKTDQTVEHGNHYGEWVLDTTFPYKPENATGQNKEAADSPITNLNQWGASYQHISLVDNFKMYVMFKPPGVNATWVPLKVVEWNWNWDATKGSNAWSLDAGADAHVLNNGVGVATSVHPEWDGNIEPFSWIPVPN